MGISRLFGQGIDVKVGEETLHIKPLTVKDLPIVMRMQSKDEGKKGEAIAEMISATLKRSYPELKQEDIDQLAFEHFEVLLDAIMKVNKLDKQKNASAASA